jgi:hypothetical protein
MCVCVQVRGQGVQANGRPDWEGTGARVHDPDPPLPQKHSRLPRVPTSFFLFFLFLLFLFFRLFGGYSFIHLFIYLLINGCVQLRENGDGLPHLLRVHGPGLLLGRALSPQGGTQVRTTAHTIAHAHS